MTTWSDLASLREQGLKPGLPVYVTDRPVLARNMRDVGCVAILYTGGEPMPVWLLDRLDVRMDFGRCELVGKVHRLMRRHGVRPARLRAWCDCAHDFVATTGPCDEGGEPWTH